MYATTRIRVCIGVALSLVIASVSLGVVATSGAASREQLKVTSTVDGRKVLPVRIRWRARPNVPSSKVAKVEYLIDHHLIWTEYHPPYYYGGDEGKNDPKAINSLVTTFLRPGRHTFTVRSVAIGGQTATDVVKARTVKAPSPPTQLVGKWTQPCSTGVSCPPGAQSITITITSVGWGFEPQPSFGDRWDARYLHGGKVVFGPEVITSRRSPQGAFCGVDPLHTWTYTIAPDGKSFDLQSVGVDPCPDRRNGIRGTWTRVG